MQVQRAMTGTRYSSHGKGWNKLASVFWHEIWLNTNYFCFILTAFVCLLQQCCLTVSNPSILLIHSRVTDSVWRPKCIRTVDCFARLIFNTTFTLWLLIMPVYWSNCKYTNKFLLGSVSLWHVLFLSSVAAFLEEQENRQGNVFLLLYWKHIPRSLGGKKMITFLPAAVKEKHLLSTP